MAEHKTADAPATEEFAVTGAINIKGVAYNAGDVVTLTEEEHAALVAAGVPIEGVEPKDADAVQADHEAGVEAQKARIEEGPAPLDEEEDVEVVAKA